MEDPPIISISWRARLAAFQFGIHVIISALLTPGVLKKTLVAAVLLTFSILSIHGGNLVMFWGLLVLALASGVAAAVAWGRFIAVVAPEWFRGHRKPRRLKPWEDE